MTSTQVTPPGAREWPFPPRRDPRGRGRCIFPGCEITCERFHPCCPQHWTNAPDVLRTAVEENWRVKDQRRWLLAVEGLRCYWLSIAP